MFFLIPWRVDVPQDRWPVMNWLILLALVAVFTQQVRDIVEYRTRQDTRVSDVRSGDSRRVPESPATEEHRQSPAAVPGITGALLLRGWSLRGLLGYMWLHGGLFHLLGNVLFLWIFGNAVCAKIGNLRYLLLYVLFGVIAGVAHLLTSRAPLVGASGAINGVVGMYLVLFYQNEITCLFAFWLIVPYVRWFAVSSVWMILLWLLWDVLGTVWGGSQVGHFAHLGGFAGGFGIALWMCRKGWITMEKYEKSLLQMWQERRRGREKEPLERAYARLGLQRTEPERQEEALSAARPAELRAVPASPLGSEPAPTRPEAAGFIRTVCACGQAIRVTQQYAGRTVRCPRCRQQVVIPRQTDFFGPIPEPVPIAPDPPKQTKDNYIHFVCTCGKKMRAPTPYAGRTTKCSRCGSRFKIPGWRGH
jgi:membrane associated rhomboid family serine protease/DNA-directed RNA polymerase subunit RPC12/RpoP